MGKNPTPNPNQNINHTKKNCLEFSAQSLILKKEKLTTTSF